ncbi:hypothetical protein [Microbaculum marinum]|uniref:Uncharacterized protein n=1 Tax=Microbaculum marinum TaxID=1764581 RepID=A0AAW9RVP9_9HYPH
MTDTAAGDSVRILRDMQRLADELCGSADPLMRGQAEFLKGRIAALASIAGADLSQDEGGQQ